jgi:hypothetical protein
MNAWIRKEIKDSVRWAPLGLVLHTLLIVYLFRTLTWYTYPQLADSLFGVVWLAAGAFATLLGIATYLPDTFGSARGYLIHRGISSEKIFFIRTVVNAGVYLITMLVPIAAIAIYLSWIGPFEAPVMPAQVVPSIVVIMFSFAFYFGASIVACRPSRWYGTRLLPLAFAFLVSAASLSTLRLSSSLLLPALFIVSTGCLGIYLLALTAKSLFVRGPSQPYPSRSLHISWAEKIVFVVSAVVLTILLSTAVLTSLPTIQSHRSYDVQFTSQGAPWIVEIENRYGRSFSQQVRVLSCLQEAGLSEPAKPTSEELFPGLVSHYGNTFDDWWSMAMMGSVAVPNSSFPNVSVFAHRGLTYVYQVDTTTQGIQQGHLLAVVGKNGVDAGATQSLSRFSGPLLLIQGKADSSSASFGLVTDDGVFQVDLNKQTISQVTDTITRGLARDSKRLALFMDDAIEVYEQPNHTNSNSLFLGKKIATVSMPAYDLHESQLSLYRFAFVDVENWTLVTQRVRQGAVDYNILSSHGGQTKSYSVRAPKEMEWGNSEQADREARFIGSLLAPGLVGAALVISTLMDDASSPALNWFVTNLFVQALVSSVLAWLAASRRGLPWSHRLVWCLVASLTGLFTWVGVLAIYPRIAHTPCHACGKRRRLEEDRCRYCQAEWQPLARLDIEMVDHDAEVHSQVDRKATVQSV